MRVRADSAVEEMRTGHQHHTGTERDQRYRLGQLQAAGSASYGADDGRSAKRLGERIAAEARQPSAHKRADRCARRDQQQARCVDYAENDAERRRANGRQQREAQRRSWRQAACQRECRPRGGGLQLAVADLIHHGRDGKHLAHVDAERLYGNDF